MQEVVAKRYDSKGHDVETVTLAVSLTGDRVHLHITGERTSKHYYLSRAAWERLISE